MLEPLTLKDFESRARTLRFRALGSACADAAIGSLLLGHHEDDLAETTLFRLMRGGNPFVKQGFARIPECEGLANVNNILWNSTSTQTHSGQAHPNGFKWPRIAKQGILLHRPLQSFAKDRLVATCRHSGIAWVEDETNQDATLTPRNTIRNLLSHHDLPRALTKPSLLGITRSGNANWEDAEGRAIKLLERVQGRLDTRSGVLTVHFPVRDAETDKTRSFSLTPTAPDIVSLLRTRAIAGFALLKAVACMVKPNSVLGTDRMHRIARAICELTAVQKSQATIQSYTSGGIRWTLKRMADEWTWMVSRQPQPIGQAQVHCVLSYDSWGEWQLFDGRFWIKLTSHQSADYQTSSDGTQTVLVCDGDLQCMQVKSSTGLCKTNQIREFQVCFLSEEGLHYFRQQMRRISKNTLEEFNAHLSTSATGTTKWTLPVITPRGKDKTVLALPSLGWQVPLLSHILDWQVQYAHASVPKNFIQEDR